MRSTLLFCGLISWSSAQAQESQPIRLLVGFAPGGTTDVVARILAKGMQDELGRTVLVENRPGAGGQIAAQALKSARPDGTTLFMSNSHTVAMIPVTTRNPGFDPAKDFAPVAFVALNPDVFVVNTEVLGNPHASLRDFTEWAANNPGRGNVGVPAPASAPEFAVKVLSDAWGGDLKAAPYRGDAPIVQDLLGGQISAGIGGAGAMIPNAKEGRLRIVAVNGTERLSQLPDVPTYAELGIAGLEDQIFTGVFAPASTPSDLLQSYARAIDKVVHSQEFMEKVIPLGLTPTSGSPEQLAARVETSRQASAELARAAGFQPQ
ncbi:MAG: tripartite tricarboxylate transporter substrate-binding protein [Pigmentiphaga sp.]